MIRRAPLGAVLAAALAGLACAQYGAPPGGERDQREPQVIATVPEPFAIVPDFSGDVVIRFDERLSERGAADAVVVSPRADDVRLSRSGNELRVRVAGGWQPGRIYRVVILPTLRDLFGNERREPAELVFSTGPPIPNTALAGLVTERISGRAPERAALEAVRRADSLVYVTPVDNEGFFSFLNLPNGTYDLVGFADVNQNWRRDTTEPASSTLQVSLAADTVAVDVALLPFDTTAARVLRATVADSVIRVELDDYVDSTGVADASARLYTLPDTTPLPTALQVMLSVPRPAADSAPGDTLAADTAAADTLGVRAARARADSLRTEPREGLAPVGRAQRGAMPPRRPLPLRQVVLLPATMPPPGEYLVEVGGIVNINGIAAGGGRAPLRIQPPADTSAAQPAPADTAAPPPAALRRS